MIGLVNGVANVAIYKTIPLPFFHSVGLKIYFMEKGEYLPIVFVLCGVNCLLLIVLIKTIPLPFFHRVGLKPYPTEKSERLSIIFVLCVILMIFS